MYGTKRPGTTCQHNFLILFKRCGKLSTHLCLSTGKITSVEVNVRIVTGHGTIHNCEMNVNVCGTKCPGENKRVRICFHKCSNGVRNSKIIFACPLEKLKDWYFRPDKHTLSSGMHCPPAQAVRAMSTGTPPSLQREMPTNKNQYYKSHHWY